MDADGNHDPRLVIEMVLAIRDGTDVVIASRYVPDGGMDGVPAWRQAASIVGNQLFRRLMGWPVRDGTSGFRAYRREAAKHLENLPAGFDVQGKIILRLAGARFAEIPLRLTVRSGGKSKLRYGKLMWQYFSLAWKNGRNFHGVAINDWNVITEGVWLLKITNILQRGYGNVCAQL